MPSFTKYGPDMAAAFSIMISTPSQIRDFLCGRSRMPSSLRVRVRRRLVSEPVTSSASSAATPRHWSVMLMTPSVRSRPA
jgi:hypothetical protein